MILKHLSLINYKNFKSVDFDFDEKINCFVGNNGVGKTNVLDSIYHLSFGKSYFNPITSQNITHDADFFVVEGLYHKNAKDEKVIVSAKRNQKKTIKRNGKIYETYSKHIGFLPLVIISPTDRNLITDGSDTRRKFMDGVISQNDPEYLNALLRYSKIVTQRNSLLKFFNTNQTFDPTTLDIYNQQLHELGSIIFEKRKAFIDIFTPFFIHKYNAITSGSETVSLSYESKLFDFDLQTLLTANLEKDRRVLYTSVGTHKDDLLFKINNHPIKKFGSQGQQKSFLIALKLAQFDFIKKFKNENPILLLDDIFDKLDAQRVEYIIKLVNSEAFGQLFISDTHAERTENIIKKISQSYKLFKLKPIS